MATLVFNLSALGAVLQPKTAQATAPAKISGFKFNDENANGVWDEGEPAISGVTIRLCGSEDDDGDDLCEDDEDESSTVTNGNGFYEFGNLNPGDYIVSEVVPAGYSNTTPVSVPVTLAPGEQEAVNFGNVANGSISGYKFNDVNGNGTWEGGEPGIPGVTIRLCRDSDDKNGNDNDVCDAGEAFRVNVTDGSGFYEFTNLAQGNYIVSEVVPSGFTPTTPSNVSLYLSAAEHEIVDFGNLGLGSITVVKNVDTDGNGDVDVVGATDWSWDITGGAQNTPTGSGQSVTVGTYTISEDQQPNFHVTNLTCDGQNFGAVESAQINVDGDGVTCTFTNAHDTGEITFDKVVVGGGPATDADWAFTIDGVVGTFHDGDSVSLATGPYAVTEAGPEGYTLTGASDACELGLNEITLTVTEEGGGVCRVTNTRDTGTLVVQKEVIRSDGEDIDDDHAFTVRLDGADPKTIAEGTDATYLTLPTGTYTVTEDDDPNYPLDGFSLDVDPGAAGAQIVVTKDQTTVLTITNRQKPGMISGFKFEDVNGNGQWEEGEPALNGWTICLNGRENCVVTGSGEWPTGYYEFNGLHPGTYEVYEHDQEQDGWTQTLPGDDYEVVVTSGTNSTHNDFGNFQNISISGNKWNDLDGDGPGGPQAPIEGWEICLTGGSLDGSVCTETDGNGAFSFSDLGPGTYTLTEESRPGEWIATSPSTISGIVATSGQDVSEQLFFNFELGTISGFKFEDVNGNDSWDEGEPALDDWEICADNGVGLDECVLTGDGDWPTGYYELSGLTAGDYTLTETPQDGWTPTVAPSPVHIGSGTVSEHNDFGNFDNVGVDVCKFVDLNGDGDVVSGDPLYDAAGGWPMILEHGDSTTTQNTVEGCTTFSNLGPGEYRLTEGPKDGWIRTTPESGIFDFTVSSGNDETFNFGNFELGSIAGKKFEDTNHNGTFDPGVDLPKAGWNIHLMNGPLIIATTATGPDGSYAFPDLAAGTYTVAENTVAGWLQLSPPPPGTYVETITSGTHLTGRDFFNRQIFPDLTVTKTDGLTVANAGQTMTYTIVVSNVGEFQAENVSVSDTLPAQATYVSSTVDGANSPAAATPNPAGDLLAWNFGTMPNGTSKTLTVTVALDATFLFGTTVLHNVANVATTTEEPNTSNNSAFDDTSVAAGPTLGLQKSVDPTTVPAGQNVTWTVTWSVAGNSLATNVTIVDPIPANSTFVSVADGGVFDPATKVITWNLGTQSPGASGAVHFVTQTASPIANGTVVTNTATIDSAETDPAISAATSVTVTSAPTLTLTKVHDKTTFVNPGSQVTYTVTIKNTGTDAAKTVVLTDTLPTGFTFSDTGLATRTITVGTLDAGKDTTITYTITVGQNVGNGFHENLATVTASNHSTLTAKAPVEVRVPQILGVQTAPALTLKKTVDPTSTTSGKTVKYSVTVTNSGDGTAFNVKLEDFLPAGLSFAVSGAINRTWAVGDLQPSESKTITYRVTVDKNILPGVYENLATASADNHDKVSAEAPLQVRKPRVLGAVLPETGMGASALAAGLAGLAVVLLGLFLLGRSRRRDEPIA